MVFPVQPVRAHDRHLRTRTCRFTAALFSPALCQVEDFSSKCSKEGTYVCTKCVQKTRELQRNIRVRPWKPSPSATGYLDQRHKACLFPVTKRPTTEAVTGKRISPTVAAGEQIARTMDRGGDIRWPEIRRACASCLKPVQPYPTPLIPSPSTTPSASLWINCVEGRATSQRVPRLRSG